MSKRVVSILLEKKDEYYDLRPQKEKTEFIFKIRNLRKTQHECSVLRYYPPPPRYEELDIYSEDKNRSEKLKYNTQTLPFIMRYSGFFFLQYGGDVVTLTLINIRHLSK